MFDALALAIQEVADVDTDVLNGPGLSDAVVQLERLQAQLEAAASKITAAWDARGCWQANGARNAGAWLAWKCHLPLNVARRRVRLGHALDILPLAAQAWADGHITGHHLQLLNHARNDRTAQAMARDEAMLIDHARTLRFNQFTKTLAYWLQQTDPDGADQRDDTNHQRRRFHLSKSIDGIHFGDFTLDPISGATVSNILTGISDELRRHDQKTGNIRTPTQRRADALVEMARRAATPNNGKPPAPLFTVLIGYETATRTICELQDGTIVNPRTLLQGITMTDFERALFDTRSRILDLGRRKRVYTGATRRAVQLQDRTCYHPTCDTPSFQCEIDHIQPWAAGGPTTLDNGRAACAFHNHLRQKRAQ